MDTYMHGTVIHCIFIPFMNVYINCTIFFTLVKPALNIDLASQHAILKQALNVNKLFIAYSVSG